MIANFENLSREEFAQLLDSIPMITILIAGADGHIDTKEKDWSVKLTDIRSYAFEELYEFYVNARKDFSEKIDFMITDLPDDVASRTAQISEAISALNPVIAKLDNKIAYAVYKSLTSFAEHVAKASGGFMRFFSVNKEEKALIGLPMLNEVILEEEPEENDENA